MNKTLFFSLALLAGSAFAGESALAKMGSHIGLGQDSAKAAPMLRNLRLDDPLVQKKYLNDPDMLRFLRATYSEACTRGLINTAATTIKLDVARKYDPALKTTVANLLDSGRVWKMSSFEMEVIFGAGYLKSANYCDCLMKEVADVDLVNPRKGLEVVEKITPAAQASCDRMAQEKTARQIAKTKE